MYYYTSVIVVDDEKSTKRVNESNKYYLKIGNHVACFPNPDCELSNIQKEVEYDMYEHIKSYRKFVDCEGIHKVEDGLYYRGRPKMQGNIRNSLWFRSMTIYSLVKYDELSELMEKVISCFD